jgi:hypothetical protein
LVNIVKGLHSQIGKIIDVCFAYILPGEQDKWESGAFQVSMITEILGGAIVKSISFSQYSSAGARSTESSPSTSRARDFENSASGTPRPTPKRKLQFLRTTSSTSMSTPSKVNRPSAKAATCSTDTVNPDSNVVSEDAESVTPPPLDLTDEVVEGASSTSKRKRAKPRKLMEDVI